MIKVVIIDDEQEARDLLRTLLEEYFDDVDVVDEASSALEGIKKIQKHNPDVLFLDVQMPHGTGFDLLESFPDREFEVIFTTAHQKYALKAIKEDAKDFLVKPIDIDDLESAVERIRKIRKTKVQKPVVQKLQLPVSKGIKFVNPHEIIRMEGDGNYTTIFFTDGTKLVISKNLKGVEELLPENMFFRSHNSHLINLNFIKELNRNEGSYIVLEDESIVPLSRRKKEEFMKMFKI